MTQAEFAEKVGITRQTINAIEAAKCSTSLELALKKADVFLGGNWNIIINMIDQCQKVILNRCQDSTIDILLYIIVKRFIRLK